MVKKDDVDELKETVHEVLEWKAEIEKKQAIEDGIQKAIRTRCIAVFGIVWSGIYWLGTKAADNFDIVKAMIEAAIKAQASK